MPENTAANVVRITVKGTLVTEQVINTYYYANVLTVLPFSSVIDAFQSNVLATQANVQSTLLTYNSIEIQQVKGGVAFDSKAIAQTGLNGGDTMPPFVAWDFTLVRGGALERNGYKRLPGVPESAVDNGFANGTALPNLAVVATALGADFNNGIEVWTPVIRRTRVNKVIQSPPKYFSISSAIYSRVGSQNSRKYGHGR